MDGREFNEEIAKAAVQGCLDGVPEEWKGEVLKSYRHISALCAPSVGDVLVTDYTARSLTTPLPILICQGLYTW